MSEIKVPFREFIDCYKDSLGVEGAQQLMSETLVKLSMQMQNEYSKDEAMKICKELKKHQGFIGIIGGLINCRILIR